MKGETGFFLGILTLAFSYFLGSLWSPDYVEFFSNGYNHLLIVFFMIIVAILMFLIDSYYEKKRKFALGEQHE